jgi:hypothetical protein
VPYVVDGCVEDAAEGVDDLGECALVTGRNPRRGYGVGGRPYPGR